MKCVKFSTQRTVSQLETNLRAINALVGEVISQTL